MDLPYRSDTYPPEMDILSFDREEIESSVSARFDRIVKSFPHKIAVKSNKYAITYKELDIASNQVAWAVTSTQKENLEPVAIFLKQDVAAIVAILGILKAGRYYIPLDMTLPASKISAILQSTQTNLVITREQEGTSLPDLAINGCQSISMDEISESSLKESISVPVSTDALAAVFYTSGSTGEPKGVKWDHRSILHSSYINIIKFPVTPEDHHSLNFSCSAAASVASIFGALLAGASLHLYDSSRGGIADLVSWVKEEMITIMYSPVSLFRQLLYNISDESDFPALRMIIVGGQTLYQHDVKVFVERLSKNCLLVNRLALSEAGGLTYFFIDYHSEFAGNIVPVGYSLEDKEIFLLNGSGGRVKKGERGEIAVRSRYLSPGYLGSPELTAKKFLPDPDGGDKRICLTGDMGEMLQDGCLIHHGRKDFAVKIRGYRVEIESVESVLHSFDSVKEIAVVAHDDKKSGEKRLVAYLVPAVDPAPTVVELRKELESTLPNYMIPSAFVLLEKMPLSHTGKVDRSALPELNNSKIPLGTIYTEPRSEIEEHLTKIWKEVLDVDVVGIQDDFFELGGDSLQLMSIYTQVEREFNITLLETDLAKCNTIELMGLCVAGERIFKVSSQDRFQQTTNGISRLNDLLKYVKNLIFAFLVFALPYSIGTKILAWFCSQSWAQYLFFESKVKLICRFLTSITSPCKEGEVVRQGLASNCWEGWRHVALSKTSEKDFRHWVDVKGLKTLNNLIRQDRGVILLSSHTSMISLVFLLLDRLGIDDVMFIGDGGHLMMNLLGISNRATKKFLTSSLYDYTDDSSKKLYLRSVELYAAQKVLKRGGVVVTLQDGSSGKSGMNLPFLGRDRRFAAGFAELAVETGAAVIPTFSSMNLKGRITMEFLSPLFSRDSDAGNCKSLYAIMIEQYIRLLEKKWREDPGSISLYQFGLFLKLPVACKGSLIEICKTTQDQR